MKTAIKYALFTLAAVVHCSLTLTTDTAVAQTPDESQATADAEDTSASADEPRYIEKQFHVKAPAPSYSRDGALLDIMCNMRLDWPHKSGHEPGTINVESQVTCNSPVAQITSLLQLEWESNIVNSNIHQNAGQLSLYNQVAANCIDGGWQAHAEVEVIFPPGTTPPSAYQSQDSQPISIACD